MGVLTKEDLADRRALAIKEGRTAVEKYIAAQYPTHDQIEVEEYLRAFGVFVNEIWRLIPHDCQYMDVPPL